MLNPKEVEIHMVPVEAQTLRPFHHWAKEIGVKPMELAMLRAHSRLDDEFQLSKEDFESRLKQATTFTIRGT